MSLSRRALVAGLGAVCAAPALAHTPYRQWKLYRQKHLVIGSHRGDPATFTLAKEAAAHLVAHLPASQARVARAKGPSRIASLMATEQMDVAVLSPELAGQMITGEGTFAAYGRLPLRTLTVLREGRALVAHERFPDGHAELVAHALIGSAVAPRAVQLAGAVPAWHRGARAVALGEG